MSWNYRVIKKKHELEDSYSIHEVYYDDGVPHSWSENPQKPYGSSVEELKSNIDMMMVALGKPVLEVYIDGEKEKLREV